MLELQRDCTDDDVKRAYRRLSVKYHPDKTGGDGTKIDQINKAKALLLDPELRHVYDRGGPQLVEAVRQQRERKAVADRTCPAFTIRKVATLAQLYYETPIEVSERIPIYDTGDRPTSYSEFSITIPAVVGRHLAEGRGIQRTDCIPGDVIIEVVTDAGDFQISNGNLIYTARLGLGDIIDGYYCEIPHPTGILSIRGKFTENKKLYFPGLGLGQERGAMIVDLVFDVSSVAKLSDNIKSKILDALPKRPPPSSGSRDITADQKTPRHGGMHVMGMGGGEQQCQVS